MTTTTDTQSETVKVRLLRECHYGQCNDVVEIDAKLVASYAGMVDADPVAVAYAEAAKQG
jgi:hypothetical protein